MRILSLNAWGGMMFDPLMAWLPTCGADILGLQEATLTPGLQDWGYFSDDERSMPQRSSFIEDLRTALPTHQASFHPFDSGPVKDANGTTWRQQFGAATLVSERLTILDSAAGQIHGTFTDHDEWPSQDRPRAAHGVRVQGERTVLMVHTHGVRMSSGKGDSPARRRQAERLAGFVVRMRRPGDLVVLAGDLNVLPNSETFDILAEIGLTDLVGTADTRTSTYTKPVRHASYLLVSDPSAVKDFRIITDPEVSDHRPLVLDV